MNNKIYFENPNKKNLQTLLNSLYTNTGYSKLTFYDKELKIIECSGKRRSFEDLYLICKTYFPKTNKKEVMKALININILFYYCMHIKKIVFHYNGSHAINLQNFNMFENFQYVKKTHTPEKLINILNKL